MARDHETREQRRRSRGRPHPAGDPGQRWIRGAFRIFNRSGWTTPAEYRLIGELGDLMRTQVISIERQFDGLLLSSGRDRCLFRERIAAILAERAKALRVGATTTCRFSTKSE